jgi:DNA-binding MarR family transcriptional regulator
MTKATGLLRGATTEASEEPLAVLVVGAGHMMTALIKPAFSASPLKPRHVLLLSVLSREPSITQQRLIEVLRVDPSVLVGLLNELEAEGVLVRVRDPQDRRRHLVQISEHGRGVYAALLDDIEAAGQHGFAQLGEDEREALRRALTSIVAAVPRAREEGDVDC